MDDPETDSVLLILENAEGGSLEPPLLSDAEPGSGLTALVPEHRVLQHVREVCKVRAQQILRFLGLPRPETPKPRTPADEEPGSSPTALVPEHRVLQHLQEFKLWHALIIMPCFEPYGLDARTAGAEI